MPKKSKSTEKKERQKLSQAEYEKKVVELANKGLTSEKIGEHLRKQGVHPQEYEGKISEILKDKYTNPDIKNVEEKLKKIQLHYKKSKRDKKAMREKDRIFAKLRKLKQYFKV